MARTEHKYCSERMQDLRQRSNVLAARETVGNIIESPFATIEWESFLLCSHHHLATAAPAQFKYMFSRAWNLQSKHSHMAFFFSDVALIDNIALNGASRVDISLRCSLLLPRGLRNAAWSLGLSPNKTKQVIDLDRAAARAALSGPHSSVGKGTCIFLTVTLINHTKHWPLSESCPLPASTNLSPPFLRRLGTCLTS